VWSISMGTWIDLFIVILCKKSCDSVARFFLLLTINNTVWFYLNNRTPISLPEKPQIALAGAQVACLFLTNCTQYAKV